MTDELQAALARAEEAERQRAFIATTACEDMKRQRDEAFTAGAEAMREDIARVFDESDMPNTARNVRALPIPAQEK